jgi:hypothetical protein
MKRLQFKIEISRTALKVYENMLGLQNKSTYEHWTAAFNPTSSYEGSWEKGSKMYFVGVDENGKKGGMISEIVENQPGKFVSIRHYGLLEGENEITTGEEVDKWTGGLENYLFEAFENNTNLTVELDAVTEFVDYFNETYPLALLRLKELVEST